MFYFWVLILTKEDSSFKVVIIYIFWGDAVYFIYLTIPVCLFATFQFWYFSFIEQRQWFDWDVISVTEEAFWYLSKHQTVTQILTLRKAGITGSTHSVALKRRRRCVKIFPEELCETNAGQRKDRTAALVSFALSSSLLLPPFYLSFCSLKSAASLWV